MRKSLHCHVDQLHDGTWTLSQSGSVRSWQPRSCLLPLHHAGSARKALGDMHVDFVGGTIAHLLHSRVCSAQFGLRELCASRQLRHFSFTNYMEFQRSAHRKIPHRSKETVTIIVDPDCELDISAIDALSTKSAQREHIYLHAPIDVIGSATRCDSVVESHVAQIVDSTAVLCNSRTGPCPAKLERMNSQSAEIGILSNIIIQHVAFRQLRVSTAPASKTYPGSCAVVSTAGYLKKFSNGRNIDAVDHVIRVGIGRTEGYEKYVGSRTDVRILRHSIFDEDRGAVSLDANERVIIIHDMVKYADEPLRSKQKKHILYQQKLPYLNFERWQRFDRLKKTSFEKCLNLERDFSTGFWAILLLIFELDLCNSMSLRGFLGHEFAHYPYHYFSTGLAREKSATSEIYTSREVKKHGHNFTEEHACLVEIADQIDLSSDLFYLSAAGLTNVRSGGTVTSD